MKLAQKLAVNYMRARLNLLAVFSEKRAAKKAFALFCTPWQKTRKPAPTIFEQAQGVSLMVKGLNISGFKWNKGGSKRILILHGFESSSKNFEVYIKALIKKNYEVLAFDAPAHGMSDGKQITLPLYVSMIEHVFFKFGGIQGFIAHSFGGLALVHAIEKLPNQADIKLVLIAPLTETSTAIDSFFRFLQLGHGVRTEFENIIRTNTGAAASWFSIPRALPSIKASVLWVHDADDAVTPLRDVEPVINEHYPNLSFLITEGLGHKNIYRNNRVVKAVIDFI